MNMTGSDHCMGIGWLVLLASSNFRPLIQAWPYDEVDCRVIFSFLKEPPCLVIGIGKVMDLLPTSVTRYPCVHSSPKCDPVTYTVSTARSTSPPLRGRGICSFFLLVRHHESREEKQIHLCIESYARVSPEL